MELGENIARYRKKQGLSQAELAELIGVTFQAVSSWERGKYAPDVCKLEGLAEALGTTPSRLLSSAQAEKLKEQDRFGHEKRMRTRLKTAYEDSPLIKAILKDIEEIYPLRTLPGTDVPFWNLPLVFACHCSSLQLGEEAVAAGLLSYHCLVLGREAFPACCPETVRNSVRLFTAYKKGACAAEALQKDMYACLLALLDAVHLFTAGRYTAAETAAFALRAQNEVLPLAEVLRQGNRAECNASWMLSYTLREQIELIRRFI